MRTDLNYTSASQRPAIGTEQVPRHQSAAAASSASSPGRRRRALRAREGPAREGRDCFTLHGTVYRLLRIGPGSTAGIREVPRRNAIAKIPTHEGHITASVTETARAGFLSHILWTDETGEILGTWCPTRHLQAAPGW